MSWFGDPRSGGSLAISGYSSEQDNLSEKDRVDLISFVNSLELRASDLTGLWVGFLPPAPLCVTMRSLHVERAYHLGYTSRNKGRYP
jgi:hypothetical protein